MPTIVNSDFDTRSLRVLAEAESALPAGKVRDAIAAIRGASEGGPTVVLPAEGDCSTTEAALLLGVSRPHLYKILDSGALAYRLVGSSTRRIYVSDLLAYRERFADARRLAAQAVFDGSHVEDRALNDM